MPMATTGFKAQMIDKRRALEHLMALLGIEGLSGREANTAGEICKRLSSAGCKSSWMKHDSAHKRIGRGYEIGNLILRIPGKGSLRSHPRRLLSGHMDTVPLCRGSVPMMSGDRIVSKGNTALGGDNRTAVAALITVVETLLRHGLPHPPLTLLFTVGEESGLYGSRYVDVAALGHPAFGFNVDGGHPDYAVIGAIGGDGWRADIYGRSAHAGLHPDRGISATLIASLAITEVSRLGYFGKIEVNGHRGTSNVGSIAGGEATNQVTDRVRVTGECRSHSKAFLRTITAVYRRAFADAAKQVRNNRGEKGRVEFVARRSYNPFKISARSEPVRRAKSSIASLGGDPKLVIADGGLDANNLSAKGVPTVTLGGGQHNPHTVDEYVKRGIHFAGLSFGT